MIQFVVALWSIILICELAAWAWPVTLTLFGLALVAGLLSLVGRRGRIMRRHAAEIEVERRNAASQLDYARRQAESRMWEEFGRHIRGER